MPSKLPSDAIRFASLCAVFFLSGFSALTYQIAWQRLLGLFSGSDSISVAIVVGAFLLGLGFGSLLASMFVDRLSARGAVLAFAACELGIAAFAIASKFFFYDFLFGRLEAFSASRVAIFVAAFGGLLLPTLLMGMSLPLLAKGLARNIEIAATRIGLLYGVNTLGATAGAFGAGFLLIGMVGFEVAIYCAATINVAVGAAAIVAARLPLSDSTSNEASHAPSRAGTFGGWCFLVFVSGFIIISLEIIWIRSISFLFLNTAYSFALVVGFFLLGDSLGMIAGTRVIERIAHPRRMFLTLQAAAVLYAVTALWLITLPTAFHLISPIASRFYWGDALGADTIATVFVEVAVILLPAAFLVGMSVPITQKAVQDDIAAVGWKVALIQVANIFGNAAGSFVTGLLFLQWFGTPGTLRILITLAVIFAAAALTDFRSRWYRQAGLIVGLVVVLIGFPSSTDFWSRLLPAEPGQRSIVGEDRTGIAVFKKAPGNAGMLYIGGKSQSNLPYDLVHVLLGILGPLLHPNPKSVFVMGFGSGATAYMAGSNPTIERVQVVEIIAPEYAVIREFAEHGDWPPANRPFNDPRYQLTIGDARHALFTVSEDYDIVEADPLEPRDSYSGIVYSIEYFRQVRARLRPGGLCVQYVPTESIRNTFLSVFPYVIMLQDYIMIGSEQPIGFDLNAIARRLNEPAIRAYLGTIGMNTDAVETGLRSESEIVTKWTPADARSADVVSDLFPKNEFYLTQPTRHTAW